MSKEHFRPHRNIWGMSELLISKAAEDLSIIAIGAIAVSMLMTTVDVEKQVFIS